MTGNTTDAAPFESLDAMKSRHKELLRTAEKEVTVDTVRERVLEFVSRGTATGVILDDPAARRVAQGLIDYWKATLYTQLRGDAEPTAPCPTTTVLRDFPEDPISASSPARGERRDGFSRRRSRRRGRSFNAWCGWSRPCGGSTPLPCCVPTSIEIGSMVKSFASSCPGEGRGHPVHSPAATGDARWLAATHLIRTWPR